MHLLPTSMYFSCGYDLDDHLSCQGGNTQQSHYSGGILTPVEYKPAHGLHINHCLSDICPSPHPPFTNQTACPALPRLIPHHQKVKGH